MKQILINYQQIFAKQLSDFLSNYNCKTQPIMNAIEYSLKNGGKRVRPALAYLVADYYGKTADYVQNIALGVEFIHTYSLIHDDLPSMDNDILRRGIPTTHVEFGEAMAILAGDALLNLGFESVLSGNELCDLKAGRYIATNSGVKGMVGGQCMDIFGETNQLNLSDIMQLYLKKTACLLRCAVVGSAIKCGASEQEIEWLENYADRIGVIFQIVDDILDVTSTTEELGKTVGKDAESNKNTFIKANGLENSKKYVVDLQELAINDLKSNLPNSDKLVEFCKFLTNRLT